MPTVTYKVGYRVWTPGGFYGCITAVKGEMVNVEFDDPRMRPCSFHVGAVRWEK